MYAKKNKECALCADARIRGAMLPVSPPRLDRLHQAPLLLTFCLGAGQIARLLLLRVQNLVAGLHAYPPPCHWPGLCGAGPGPAAGHTHCMGRHQRRLFSCEVPLLGRVVANPHSGHVQARHKEPRCLERTFPTSQLGLSFVVLPRTHGPLGLRLQVGAFGRAA